MSLIVSSFVLTVALAVAAGTAMADEQDLAPLHGEGGQKESGVTHATYSAQRTVRVTMDFAELLALDAAATTIIVGNPAIVDASLSDNRTVILTGKTAGTTNFMALEESGDVISNIAIEVVAAGPHVITVHQGLNRQTYTCVRRCDPVLSVGDEAQFFSTTASQIDARHSFADVAE